VQRLDAVLVGTGHQTRAVPVASMRRWNGPHTLKSQSLFTRAIEFLTGRVWWPVRTRTVLAPDLREGAAHAGLLVLLVCK